VALPSVGVTERDSKPLSSGESGSSAGEGGRNPCFRVALARAIRHPDITCPVVVVVNAHEGQGGIGGFICGDARALLYTLKTDTTV
jgi:hypothetical protein